MGRVAYRHVEFVCGDHAESGITKFPPKLMTDRNDLDGLRRGFGLLDAMNYTSGRKKQYQHNKNGNHRPSKFYLIAAVDWWRFTAVIVGSPAEFYNGVCE